MPGLFFIALNRVLAPAFYAQSDTKSPTLAGIISFVFNICFAVLLVRPLRGAGIALALSLASAINTVLLLVFLRKKPNITLTPAFSSVLLYILKLIILSVLAAIPVYFLSPVLLAFFSNRGRIVSYGIPLMIGAIVYIMLGIAMLAIVRDKNLIAFTKMIANRGKNGNRT